MSSPRLGSDADATQCFVFFFFVVINLVRLLTITVIVPCSLTSGTILQWGLCEFLLAQSEYSWNFSFCHERSICISDILSAAVGSNSPLVTYEIDFRTWRDKQCDTAALTTVVIELQSHIFCLYTKHEVMLKKKPAISSWGSSHV
jgi:hypothetical protein